MLGGLLGLVGLSGVAAVLVTAMVTPAIALSGAAANSALTMFEELPAHLDIERLMLPSNMYAKDPATGNDILLAQFYDQNRSPVTFDQVAPIMYDAVLSSEDKNFYKHGGVDLVGTMSALYDNLRGSDTRGGSSISQQYVKNVLVQKCEATAQSDEERIDCYTQATQSQGADGIQRKLQEMRYAVALEEKYSKNEILLGYLNIAGFGGLQYGVDAAARYYFGVPVSSVTIAQAATLAGMVQNPNTYRIDKPEGSTTDDEGNPLNSAEDGYTLTKERRDYVLDRLLADGKITKERHDEAQAEPVTPVITPATTGCTAAINAQYFCQYVKGLILSDPVFGETEDDRAQLLRRGGLEIHTTLDWRLQNEAVWTMQDLAPAYVEGISFGAAGVNLEAGTGRVLTMTQNTNFSEDPAVTDWDLSYSSLVYAANYETGRSNGFQTGSTFKLFTLIDWLEQGHSVNEVVNGRQNAIKRVPNSCLGDWVNVKNERIDNYGGGGGFVGTVMQFTAQSLNTGFVAMAQQLDMCDIANVATRLGVTLGDGSPITMANAYNVLGSDNVAPLQMAAAYATVANNGIYCQPKAIDRVVDADGRDLTPVRTCTQVLEPNIAATAAYALRGVMTGGGTGAPGNPGDGTPVIGKTGTHQEFQTWLIESSTKVTTAVWVGTTKDEGDITRQYYNDRALNQVRFEIAARMQGLANSVYGGDNFPEPDGNLTRTILRDVPSVIGMTVDAARATLEDAGFEVAVGDAVDSAEAAGIVVAQNPEGRAGAGSVITISPSNGLGSVVPDVAGQSYEDADKLLRAAGFTNVHPGTCTPDETSTERRLMATGTSPAAGTAVNLNTPISINLTSWRC